MSHPFWWTMLSKGALTNLNYSKEKKHDIIAKNVAKLLHNNTLVNLGIGIPGLVSNYVSAHRNIIFQSENGIVGVGPYDEDQISENIKNAGGQPVTLQKGGAFIDSSVSFGLIRGGHVHTTVLGALQVDQSGNIANYIIPGKFVPGMGGAMDLLVGAKQVIVAMEHTSKDTKKILTDCTLPLTAQAAVDYIVTEMAIIAIKDKSLELIEWNDDFTLAEIQDSTEATLTISPSLKPMLC